MKRSLIFSYRWSLVAGRWSFFKEVKND